MRVTWWGHSTVRLDDSGVRLLVDPVLTSHLGHLRRRRGPTPPPSVCDVDAVLVSHLHADHLHVPSLLRTGPGVRLIAPVGTRAFLRSRRGARGLADRCAEVAPGATVDVGGLRVDVVAARHDDRRHPWSTHRAPPVQFVTTGTGRVWFGGDTDLHPSMAELGPVDLALVPVGGWGPNLGPGHLDPARAVEAVRRVGARTAVPVHYGTFWPVGLDRVRRDMFLPPGARFAELAAEGLPGTDVRVLAPGDSLDVVTSG